MSQKKNRIFLNLLSSFFLLGCLATLIGCNQSSESSTNDDQEDDEEKISITLSETDFDLYIGSTKQINATTSAPGVSVNWKSTNPEVASCINGLVAGLSEGYTEIIASVGNVAYASIIVGVSEYIAPIDYSPTITVVEGYDVLTVFNAQDSDEVDLTKGLVAKDYLENDLEIEVVDDDDFDTSVLGEYNITYKAVDEDNNSEKTISRKAIVTYFGITKETLNSLETSSLDTWSFTPNAQNVMTAEEWVKHVVPGHSANWNKFEGPYDDETSTYMNCVIMHGSDTNGHGFDVDAGEAEDEYPNTILYNKINVDAEKPFLHVQCSVNPYPDYNNMISKFRFTVMDPEDLSVDVENYRTQLAPISAAGTELDYAKVRNGMFEDIDLSDYAGKTIILLIEQDSSTDIYQERFYLDIGYEEFQLTGIINETRDTFVVYGMALISAPLQGNVCAFNDNEWRKLTLDESTSWGSVNSPMDESDCNTFGLRGNVDLIKKWSYYNKNEKVDISQRSGYFARQFLTFASTPDEINDLVAEQCLVNKVKVVKNKFVLFAGTDSATNSINFRFSVVTDKGAIIKIAPSYYDSGKYTPLEDSWGLIQCGEWVYGCKMEFDISPYLNKEVTFILETDQAAEGNPTIWINAMEMID